MAAGNGADHQISALIADMICLSLKPWIKPPSEHDSIDRFKHEPHEQNGRAYELNQQLPIALPHNLTVFSLREQRTDGENSFLSAVKDRK